MNIQDLKTGNSFGMVLLLTVSLCFGSQEQQRHASSPIHQAAKEGDVAAVKLILEKGADVNAKNKDGCTPLILVAQKGFKKKGFTQGNEGKGAG